MDRAAELKHQHAKSLEYRNQSKHTDIDAEIAENALEEPSRLDWTAKQWEDYEKGRKRTKSGSNYKSHFDLAHSTYLKEMSRKEVDQEKYKRSLENGELKFDVRLAKEDVDALAESLQAASERKLKRRRTKETGGDFITEKNRQFNMKLDREYGGDEKED